MVLFVFWIIDFGVPQIFHIIKIPLHRRGSFKRFVVSAANVSMIQQLPPPEISSRLTGIIIGFRTMPLVDSSVKPQ